MLRTVLSGTMPSTQTLLYMCGAVLSVALAGEQDMDNIPNGYRVPHPCDRSVWWIAVGHSNTYTGSKTDLNQFGKDFRDAGFEWTPELCEKDSDGDGMKNGYELGDDVCRWKRGEEEQQDNARSHPGINELTYICGH